MQDYSIRPSIFIGIGGTGIKAIARTKRMFEDAYGADQLSKLPLGFICVDYDNSSAGSVKNVTDLSNDFISVPIGLNPLRTYTEKKDNFPYYFERNARVLKDSVIDGAAQVRGYGRFLTELIMAAVRPKLQQVYARVRSVQATMSEQSKKINKVDCYLSMSIAGGTGCGSFINVAMALRQLFQDNVRVVGYGVLHTVFRIMDPTGLQTPNVVRNAYSAIMDLDYLMTASPENPISMTINGTKDNLKQPLYDQFYVIDSSTDTGNSVGHVNDVCEVMGKCLFSAAGDAGGNIDSLISNVNWQTGNYDFGNKRGWVHGLGACEIIYDGAALAELYADKVAVELIKQLRDSESDVVAKAVAWTEENRIREDGSDFDQLIDSIYEPAKIQSIPSPGLSYADSMTDIRNVIATYVNELPNDFPTEKDNLKKLEDLRTVLRADVDAMVNADKGVGTAIQFLESLAEVLASHKGEMENERAEKAAEVAALTEALNGKDGLNAYEAESNKFAWKFKGSETKQATLDALVSDTARAIVLAKLEAKRREVASAIFTGLLTTVAELKQKVDTLDNSLLRISAALTEQIRSRQSESKGGLVFTYDISIKERISLKLNKEEVKASDFVVALGEQSLLDVDLSDDSLDKLLYYYTRNSQQVDDEGKTVVKKLDFVPFPKFNQYANRLIDDVIYEMKEKDPKAYENLLDVINRFSARLLTVNDNGVMRGDYMSPSNLMVKAYSVSYYSHKDVNGKEISCPFDGDPNFKTDATKVIAFLPQNTEYYRQRMIFFRSDFGVIPYCIGAFNEYVLDQEYYSVLKNDQKPHPHFDKLLYEEMVQKDFSLKPGVEDEAMLLWVLGNIFDFGWFDTVEKQNIMAKNAEGVTLKCEGTEEVVHKKYVRFSGSSYQYWNEKAPDAGKNAKWQSLNTKQRATAFKAFKAALGDFKDVLKKQIADKYSVRQFEYDAKIQDLIAAGIFDYVDKEAIGPENSATLFSKQSANMQQYADEWNFIKDKLAKAIKQINVIG